MNSNLNKADSLYVTFNLEMAYSYIKDGRIYKAKEHIENCLSLISDDEEIKKLKLPIKRGFME